MAPPRAQQVDLDPMELEELEQLNPSAFEYQPTPTQVDDSAPDNLPDHLRSHVKVALTLPTASFDSESSGGTPPPPPMSSSEHQPSAPPVEPAPTKRRVTFQVASSNSDTDSDHSDWSEASNPVERLPVYASQQSADSTFPSQPSGSCELVEEASPWSKKLRLTSADAFTSHGTASTSSGPAPQFRPSQYPRSSNTFVFAVPPPSVAEVLASMEPHGQTAVIYQDPYFSSPGDIPGGKSGDKKILRWEHAGRRFDLKDATIRNLPLFEHAGITSEQHLPDRRGRYRSWEYAPRPPTVKEMEDWLVKESSGEWPPSARHSSSLLTLLPSQGDFAKEKERRLRQLEGHNVR